MDLLSGLSDHQVLQRTGKNVSETVIHGKSEISGSLLVNVTKAKKPIKGFHWKPICSIRSGEFRCVLSGMPVGGPYDIILKVEGKDGSASKEFLVRDILVGDVWILGGQSNMEGVGLLKDAAKPRPDVRAFYMDDRWATAKDPIHVLYDAIDPVHEILAGGVRTKRDPKVGVGPGVAFGQRMAERSGVPQGLICCAHGGTSMDQWSPELKGEGGKSLYGATLRRFMKNGERIAGVVWYQGSSDTLGDPSKYTAKMINLVKSFRKDFGNSKLPFVMVQIATYFCLEVAALSEKWNSIREQQRLMPKVIKNLTVVPAIDLTLDDAIHISGKDQSVLGKRLAEAAWTLIKGKNSQKPPIELKDISMRDTGALTFDVLFDNVMGKLQCGSQPTGFVLIDKDGNDIPVIYRVRLEENCAMVQTTLPIDQLESGVNLYYGYSSATYCNITDSAGRSLPAFGPIGFQAETNTWHVRTIHRSDIIPGETKLENVSCPKMSDSNLNWREQTFITSLADIHQEIAAMKDARMVFFSRKFRCPEPMKLRIGLGYDGPVKVWLNGKEICYDPNGTNPATKDKFKFDFDAPAGEHEIIICLSTNFGRAWGVYLTLTRKDVPARLVKKGRDFYVMPEAV